MIIIEKTAKNVSEAIDMIIGEVFGCRSEFAESVQKFMSYKYPKSINDIACIDNNRAIERKGIIGTDIIHTTSGAIGATNSSTAVCATEIKTSNIGLTNHHRIESYKDFVEYALFILGNNIPTPLRLGNLYNLTIGNNFTAIRFPNNTSVSIKVFTNKDSIKYGINITFHSTPVCDPYVRESDEYKSAIKNEWKVKEDFNKPIKKNI